MTLRVLIADDEPLALDLLTTLISSLPNATLVGSAAGGEATVTALLTQDIDLLLLDVRMPEVNGFDVIRRVQADILPMIVFTSAHADYALDAFGVHAVDYLLKPIGAERLRAAVDKAAEQKAVGYDPSHAKPSLLEAARAASARVIEDMDRESRPEPTDATIVIQERGRTVYLPKSDIVWVEAAGDYVLYHLSDEGVHEMRATMTEAAALLGAPDFQRIHRSTIVNTLFVRQVVSAAKGDAIVRLMSGHELRASRRYKVTPSIG